MGSEHSASPDDILSCSVTRWYDSAKNDGNSGVRASANDNFEIRPDDLSGEAVRNLLREHLKSMHVLSPPQSVHALDIQGLSQPDVTFWSVWEGPELLGCGALKELLPDHGEIKSMRTAASHLRRGVARYILSHIIEEARRRGYRRLSLETGSMAAFSPARELYARSGFQECDPFGSYVTDPNSVFMTMEL